jgi:hypothetical protein
MIGAEARELYRRVYTAEHQRNGMVFDENERVWCRSPLAHMAAMLAYEDYLQLFDPNVLEDDDT